MPKTVPVLGEGITLDLLLWRAYGAAGSTSAMLNASLALNRGLAARGAVLALGAVVRLADLPRPSERALRRSVDLFGGGDA